MSMPSPEQALVWVAGAHVSVGYNSSIHLTEAGDLILFDSSKGAVVWCSNTHNSSVLLNAHQDVVRRSFAAPSDTLLPGRNLTSLQMLRAASRNSVSSSYRLWMDTSGQLKLAWETNVTYWETETTALEPILASVFTKEAAFQLLDTRSRPVWSRFGDDHNDFSVSFRFLRLDADGNLRMYSWAAYSKSWRKVWQAVENQCDVFVTCGLSGVCVLAPWGNTTCECPFGSNSSSNLNCLAPYNRTCSSGSTMVTHIVIRNLPA